MVTASVPAVYQGSIVVCCPVAGEHLHTVFLFDVHDAKMCQSSSHELPGARGAAAHYAPGCARYTLSFGTQFPSPRVPGAVSSGVAGHYGSGPREKTFGAGE